MELKIRRGLGLLVVAVIAYLVLYATTGTEWRLSLPGQIVELLLWLVALVGLFGGLGLLAYGLLRKPR